MLTGLMPHRNGLMGLASGGHWEGDPDVPTLPQLLQEAGYATACFGTWHISVEFWDRGIEVGDQDADCERAAANAIQYLRERPGEVPFYLMVGFGKPHRPFTDTWPDLQAPEGVIVPGYLRDTWTVREEMSRLYGEVSRMDAAVGAVLDVLRELDRDGNTVVVFTSDHGIGMPLAKGTLYDPGIKIPLIVRWKRHVQGGRRCQGLASNVDLLPSLLDAVGEAQRIPEALDGRSLWPFVSRGQAVSRDRIFAEQTPHYLMN